MTRFDDLDRAFASYLDAEAAAPAPAGLLEISMTQTASRRPRPTWLARLQWGSVAAPRSDTARTLGIAIALVALLAAIVGIALLGGSRNPNPLLADVTTPPSASAPVSPSAVAALPVDEALRATWLGFTPSLATLGNGAGPVELEISADGTQLSASNFAPGAEFDSTIVAIDQDQVRLTLDRPSAGCEAGTVGTYRWVMTSRSSLLELVPVSDACPSREEAIGRTWGRSLAGPTSLGTGFVTTMDTPFLVSLPDQKLAARTLRDMIEIGGPDGFSLMAFRNPQGFADACSTDEKRVPYAPGADAFADFLERNPSLTTVLRETLTVGGLPAIHIVTRARFKAAGGPCDDPPDGLYLWTPKDCACHFIGGHDSLYIVDLPNGDTLLFEVSPVDETNPVERQIIDSLQIPAHVPGT